MYLLLLLLACFGPKTDPDDEDESEEEESETDDTFTCDVPELKVNGEDPPAVGDEWTVFLWCGDTLMTGAMVLSFTPPELAEVTDNVALFVEPGDGVMKLQVGRYWQERDVSVGAQP